ncbi:hypothetical protein D9M68_842430 [compost metagenome]
MYYSIVHAVAHLERRGGLGELLCKGIVDARLHQHAVCSDASLAGVAVFGGKCTLDCGVDVSIVKDDEGSVTTQLHAGLFDGRSALRKQLCTHFGRTSEGQLPHHWACGELTADSASRAGNDVAYTPR